MPPFLREKTAGFIAGLTFLGAAILFFALRAYVLLFSGSAGPAPGSAAGFLEDAAFAAALALLTLLAVAAAKRLYFATIFPLKIFVALVCYANLQYVNFYGDNIRLFDLEYIQNMGGTWKDTLRDFWVRPLELLFLAVPLAALILGGVVLHKTRIRRMPGRKLAAIAVSLAACAVLGGFGGAALKKDAETSDYARNNLWVGFLRDVPRIGGHVRSVRKIRTTTNGESGAGPAGLANGGPTAPEPPFPLDGDEVRYGRGYPYIKIPKRDAARMGIAAGRESGSVPAREKSARPARNIVFIVLESFRVREIGAFGGAYGLTPEFDSLASKGTLFTDFYGHCDMTAGAEFTSLNSFYDVFKGVTVLRKHDRISLFSLPEILGIFGYQNLWINSWPADFDNSRNYFRRHGNFAIYDKAVFPPSAVESGWSFSDEDTMNLALKAMDESRKPFFAVVLTATNHMPYEVPDKRFELGLASDVFGRYLNTFHYTDYALGRFFDMIRNREYFKNTVFFIFADTGNNRTPASKVEEFERSENEFHIPLLIYDPADETGRTVGDVAGQVDLAPTVLDMLGIRAANPFVGRSLLRKADSPFYLAYHGRGAPMVRYYDQETFCCYHTLKGDLWVYGRKDGLPFEVSPDRRSRIIANITATLDLGDWAIYNDRIWDRRLEEFYRALYGK